MGVLFVFLSSVQEESFAAHFFRAAGRRPGREAHRARLRIRVVRMNTSKLLFVAIFDFESYCANNPAFASKLANIYREEGAKAAKQFVYRLLRVKVKACEIRAALGIPSDPGAKPAQEAHRLAWSGLGYAQTRFNR